MTNHDLKYYNFIIEIIIDMQNDYIVITSRIYKYRAYNGSYTENRSA
jgi:hypothetical protein